MIQFLGWFSTFLILLAYVFNSRGSTKLAMWTWIIGDVFYIIYDLFILNFSHMVLSLVVILINVYGIIKNLKK